MVDTVRNPLRSSTLKYCSERLLKAENQDNPDPTFPAPPAPNILVKVNEM